MAELTHLVLSSLCLGVMPLGLVLAVAVFNLIGLNLELLFCQPTHVLGGLWLLWRRIIIHLVCKKIGGLIALSLMEGQRFQWREFRSTEKAWAEAILFTIAQL